MLLSTPLTLQITLKLLDRSVMPKPVFLMTVQEAHKEYNSLTDQIQGKYKQLDSGKFGSPGIPAFDANSKGIIQAHVLQALKTFRF